MGKQLRELNFFAALCSADLIMELINIFNI